MTIVWTVNTSQVLPEMVSSFLPSSPRCLHLLPWQHDRTAPSLLLGTVGHHVMSPSATWKWEDLQREATVLSEGLCLVAGTYTQGAPMTRHPQHGHLHLRCGTRHTCEFITCHYVSVCSGCAPARHPNA